MSAPSAALERVSSSDWEVVSLEDVAEIFNGGTPKSKVPEYWGGDVQWLTPAEMGKMSGRSISQTARTITAEGLARCSARLVPPDSVILSTRAPIGHLAINESPMAFNQGCRGIVPGPKLDHLFLYYFLVHSREKLEALGTGTTFKELAASRLRALQIPLPPLEEQQRIIAILDQAFAALDRARECAEANLANAGQLFELTLFGKFSEEGSDWANCTVGDLVTLQRGFDITKAQQREGDVPVVSSSGSKSFHDTAKATAPGVVVGRKGSIGSVHYLEEDFWPHDTTLYVKDFKGNDPRLIYYMLRGLKLADLDTGAANPSLNRNLVHPLEVSCPPLEQQKAVADRLFEIERFTNDIASQYASQLADIAALRQSLLQQAFSGQLT